MYIYAQMFGTINVVIGYHKGVMHMKEYYKIEILKLIESVNNDSFLRYLYILLKEQIANDEKE